MTDIQKTDAEMMSELPLLVRDIVERSNWRTQLRKIVTERHLRVDQGAFLETAVLKFIVGNQSAEEMAAGITNELKLDQENLKNLFEQLDREIFTPMKNDLEKSLADGDDMEANPPSGSDDKPESKAGTDDLEAMINAGDDLLSAKPTPPVSVPPPSPVTPVATPAVPIALSAPATSRSASDAVLAANPLASARERLAAPVVRSAEVSPAMLSKPIIPPAGAPATPTDPYREPAH